MSSPALSIVIPAYNEEEYISSTVHTVFSFLSSRKESFEIVIVDDGSSDQTVSRARELQASLPHMILVCLDENHGKGYAVREGMKLCRGDIILFLDADGSTPINELPKFLDAHAQGADIAVGSRYLSDSTIVIQQPWYRVLLGRVGNFLIQLVLLPGINDTQCGFKSFTRRAAQQLIRLQTIDRWGFDMELLAIGRLLNFTIAEIPISWTDTTNRSSRLRPIKDAHRTLSELLRIKRNIRTNAYRLSS